MMLAVTCILFVALTGGAAGELAAPERLYKILMLLPVSSKSHRNVFMPLAEALADRGHKIVMLTNHPKSSKHPNIQEVNHGLPYFHNINMFSYLNDPTGAFSQFTTVLPAVARDLYNVPEVKDLYERRKEFDLFMVDHAFNEVAYPFLHEATFIMVTTPGIDYRQSAVLGNVLHPAYVPNHMTDFPRPLSIWNRFLNAMIQIGIAIYWRHWTIIPPVQKEISAQFPELPPLLDIERNMSLALMNTHFTSGLPLPLLPSQVEEIESWISEAGSSGVIYFNLGTVASGNSIPVQYRDIFIKAFRRLPQRVIWKYEGELENIPDNVKISEWLPQQDILAHDNVKMFITHCGLLSLQESIYHATPLLALPIFADQPRNAMFVRNSELGHFLEWEELTEDMIIDAVADIITNTKYKENMLRMSRLMRDQLTTSKERAVFWTEYVIRHHGAPHLRSPAAQLSWVEFLMLDVILLLHLALFIIYFILRRILKVISAKILNRKKKIE
ncbi:UDP-glycosyltransferase UGT5 isoform X2 [Cherax quadricarinatus]|uniref:UDP-glycosyltransferase UGT5 isoform X2 n=1 Tax=Cherax quadricarinatus TaxID=27406 RepID=UPI00387EAA38